MIKFIDIMKEMPHVDYDKKSEKDFQNKLIDFNFEKMPISQDEKQELLKNFLDKGVVGIYKHKFIRFTNTEAHFLSKEEAKKYKMLPDKWTKYISMYDD